MTTMTTDFVTHQLELVKAIMVKRDKAEAKLAKSFKTIEKIEFAHENESPYQKVKKEITTLEKEISTLTSEGRVHIVKIDRFNVGR
jgi:polyhydroxyalkanoate synthesis regulator phasin